MDNGITISALKYMNGGRSAVTLSDGRRLIVPGSTADALLLCEDMELSSEQLRTLEDASEELSCRQRAYRILGIRPMSCREMYRKLVDKGERPEAAEKAIQELLELHYLDDAKYARTVVRHYSEMNYGILRIKNELYARGVPRELWDEALEELPEEDDTVYELLCKMLDGREPEPGLIKKVTGRLYRRGFVWEQIRPALERYREEREE